MKNLYLPFLFFLICSVNQVFSQQPVIKTAYATVKSPDPVSIPPGHSEIGGLSLRGVETVIGTTVFDLQTYDGMPKRLHYDGAGKVSAIWMSGDDSANGFPDRGITFNQSENGVWGSQQRVEADSFRSGFPAMDVLSDGTVVTAAHLNTGAPPYRIEINRLAPGATDWEVSVLPSTVPTGLVWPYITAGGPDGQTLHLIAINFEPTANREIRYFRSQDGGDTWDIQDQVIPGLDTVNFGEMFACSYAIDAYDNTVAIAHFGEWEDCSIFKSTDNGSNWTETKFLDFPLPLNYVPDSGYTADIVEPHGTQPDPLAIFTSDGGGAVLVDHSGTVHVAFGNRYVIDIDLTNATTEYYPPSSGIAVDSDISGISYWNEDMGSIHPFTVGNLVDADGDGAITFTYPDTIPDYWGNNLVSFPGFGTDEDGNVYLVYSATTEDFEDDIERLQYRHVYVTKTEDGGGSWSPAYDLINPDLADPDGFYFEEATYPSIAKLVDDKVRIMYQMDFTPDAFVIHNYVSAVENSYIFVELNADLTPVSAQEITGQASGIKAYPNPAGENLTIEWKNFEAGTSVSLRDFMGREINNEFHQAPSGSKILDLKGLPAGVYFLTALSGREIKTIKIMKQ